MTGDPIQDRLTAETIDTIRHISSTVGIPEEYFVDKYPRIVFNPRFSTSRFILDKNVIFYSSMEKVHIGEESGHFLHLTTNDSFALGLFHPFTSNLDRFFANAIAEGFGYFSSRLVSNRDENFLEYQLPLKIEFRRGLAKEGTKNDRLYYRMLKEFYAMTIDMLGEKNRSSARSIIDGLVEKEFDTPFSENALENMYHAVGYDLGARLFHEFERTGDPDPIRELLSVDVGDCFNLYHDIMD